MAPMSALAIYLTVYFFMALIFAFPIDWVISYWLEFSGRADTFGYWHGFLVALIPGVGQFVLTVAILTFVLSFFL